ncbi:Peptidyl-tRNA hydrolase, PTH2 [Dillenia turbinata]|uniref:peptidyl-tRNA hydrolase n=1 Tax=Dillenia turbinata TaxID=194707 RepID=A0AAN8V9Z9_9MAGN
MSLTLSPSYLKPSLSISHFTKSGFRVRVLSRFNSIRPMSSSATESAGDTAPQNSSAGESANSDVLVQYVVMRRDLVDTWPVGSIVSQGCHAAVSAIWAHRADPHTIDYCSPDNLDSMHKVTLEVKGEPQMVNLSEKLTAGGIAYKLWIEQPENYPTCLATKPYPKSVVAPLFKKLKLLK